MGMDVYGRKPTAPEGEYFRRNIWCWRPLADFCLNVAPKESRPCKDWHTNDGYGLNAKQALRLAQRLDEFIRDGSAAQYIARRDAELAALPENTCSRCQGTGKARPVMAYYRLDLDDVTEFAAFLKTCGGFEIR